MVDEESFSNIDLKKLRKGVYLSPHTKEKVYKIFEISKPEELKQIDRNIEKLQKDLIKIEKDEDEKIRNIKDDFSYWSKRDKIEQEAKDKRYWKNKDIKKKEKELKKITISMKEIVIAPRRDKEQLSREEVINLIEKKQIRGNTLATKEDFFGNVTFYKLHSVFPSQFNSEFDNLKDFEWSFKNISKNDTEKMKKNIYSEMEITNFEEQLKKGDMKKIGGISKREGDYHQGYIVNGEKAWDLDPEKEYLIVSVTKGGLRMKELNCESENCKTFTKSKNSRLPIIDYRPDLIQRKSKKKIKKSKPKEIRKVIVKSDLCVKGTIRREGNNMVCKLNSDVEKLTKKFGNRKKALKQAEKVIQSRFIKK